MPRSSKSGKATKTFTADELKAIKLKTPDQYTLIGVSVPQLDIPSKTNGTAKYGIDVMLPGMVYGAVGHPAGALRRHGEIGRRFRGEEGAGLHQGRHPRRQDRHHHRLGGGGRQHLCRREEGGGRAEDRL